MSNLTGQSLGRYHILEQLGEGGMATVYKAYDTRLERNVAIKVILPGHEHSETFRLRFDREAKALAALSHPNIVKVLDYGEQESTAYLVMEFIPSGTLKNQLGQPLPWRQAVRLLLPIARALEYAHLHNIIHRDVKPANILLTESGEPMLSDFGISKMLENEQTVDLTGTGVGLGTPDYMAPEQGLGQGVDFRADLYAMGVILYEMITGRKPYRADTPMAIMLKKTTEPLPRPSKFVPDLPEVMEDFLVKVLAKEPQNRFDSAAQMIAAMELLLEMKETVTMRIKQARPKIRWLPWLSGGLGLAILLGLCITGLVVFLPRLTNQGQPSPTPTELVNIVIPTESPTAISPTPKAAAPLFTSAPETSWKYGQLVYLQRNSRGRHDMYLLDLVQNSSTLLLSPTTNQQYYGPWLSPDSKQVVYYNINGGDSILDLQTLSVVADFGLCNSPVFSPDGSKIICGDRDNMFRILDSGGRQVGTLPTGLNGRLPNWSPDGTQIVFSVVEGHQSSIWRMNLSGGQPIRLANEPGENYCATWSPDGQWIAYQAGPSGYSDIWIMKTDGTAKDQITSTPGGWSRCPTWSPNGDWLVFISSLAGSIAADYGEIYVISPETEALERVTQTGGTVYDWRVSWGP